MVRVVEGGPPKSNRGRPGGGGQWDKGLEEIPEAYWAVLNDDPVKHPGGVQAQLNKRYADSDEFDFTSRTHETVEATDDVGNVRYNKHNEPMKEPWGDVWAIRLLPHQKEEKRRYEKIKRQRAQIYEEYGDATPPDDELPELPYRSYMDPNYDPRSALEDAQTVSA